MREIKFRAWVKDYEANKYRMIDWFLDFFSDMSPVTNYGGEFPDKDNSDIILMQYTGLKDKNGKEIYEGDFIGWPGTGLHYEIEFEDGAFKIAHSGTVYEWICFYKRRGEEVEIVGNIYENPELLTN